MKNRTPLRSRASSLVAGTDMTAMVDVTFLLLIFFMVTASFTLQTAIAMPRQMSDLASRQAVVVPPARDIVSLTVDPQGSFYLASPSGEQQLVGKQSLLTALKVVSGLNSNARLEILVDSDARLQAMVDAIDAGTIAGFRTLTVTETHVESEP